VSDTDADFTPLGDWTTPGAGAGAHLLVHDPAGRVLLQLRDGAPGDAVPWAYPGLWSLFGGGVEPGEPLRAAALRELAEETGLAVPPAALAPFARVLSRWRSSRLRLYVYTLPLPCPLDTIRLGEGAGFAMMTPAQVAAHPLIPEIRLVVAHFLATHG
jgi:8-oxo-dGTP diphosphatase